MLGNEAAAEKSAVAWVVRSFWGVFLCNFFNLTWLSGRFEDMEKDQDEVLFPL